MYAVAEMPDMPNGVGVAGKTASTLRHPGPERKTDAVIRIA
jgi:hypothetical protein